MSILPLTPPQRGFESAELEQRTVELQKRLRAQNIDAAFLRPNQNFAISVASNRSSGKVQLDLGFWLCLRLANLSPWCQRLVSLVSTIHGLTMCAVGHHQGQKMTVSLCSQLRCQKSQAFSPNRFDGRP